MPTVMDGYVRVSRVMGREGDSYISPRVQREAIEKWAAYKGVEIAEWHIDEDWSGGTHERPGLEAAVARALDGETDGIVSWKIDRFSRATEHGLRDLRRLRERNARLAFVVEDIDTSGAMGQFVYTVMLAMAEYFLENIKASWTKAKTEAHERGAKIGPTPFGYQRVTDGLLEPHPVEGPIVTEAFRVAAEQGLSAAHAYLSGLGLRREHGKRAGQERSWAMHHVRRLLENRVYLGEQRWGDLPPVRDAHEPLTDPRTFDAAQPPEARGRRAPEHFPLSGVARCGTCGEPMVGGRAGQNVRTYRCRASLKSWKGERCEAPATTTAARLEDLVRSQLADLADGEWIGESGGDYAEMDDACAASEAALDEFIADTEGAALLRRVGRYETALQAHVSAVEEAQQARRRAAKSGAQNALVATPDLIRDADLADLGVFARGMLAAVTVQRGRGTIESRAVLVLRGAPAQAGVAAA